MNTEELWKARSQEVVKANDLIQKKRYSLTLREQKTLLYLISKIKPEDDPNTAYTFSVNDFIEICNFNTDGGWNYNYTKDVMRKLISTPVEYQEGRYEVITSWFSSAKFDKDTNTFTVKFNDELIPYLYHLQQHFTIYPLEYVLPMNSTYGIRLYELCRSIAYKGENHIYSLEELKDRLDSAKYPVYKDFRARVLEPAIEDINNYTDLDVAFKAKRTGKKITHIELIINKASNQGKRYINRYHALGLDDDSGKKPNNY